MPAVKAKARFKIFYAPQDEILATEFDVGILPDAAVDYIDTSADAVTAVWDDYMNLVLLSMRVLWSTQVTVMGWQMRQVGETRNAKITRVRDDSGLGVGDALSNDNFLQIKFFGDTVMSGNPPRPRFLRSGMHLSGCPIQQQDGGVWDSAYQSQVKTLVDVMHNTPNDQGAGDPTFLCLSGDLMSTVVGDTANPLVGRMRERIGNRPQGRPSRV